MAAVFMVATLILGLLPAPEAGAMWLATTSYTLMAAFSLITLWLGVNFAW